MNYLTRNESGLQYTYLNGHGCGVTGSVDVLPMMSLHAFMLEMITPNKRTLFKSEVKDILHQLPSSIVNKPSSGILKTNDGDHSHTSFTYTYRIYRLSRQYVKIAQRYGNVQISLSPIDKAVTICTRCLRTLIQDEDELHCPKCNTQQKTTIPLIRTIHIINVAHELEAFQNTVDMYEGRITIPDTERAAIFTSLDEYFALNDVPPRQIICTLEPDDEGQKPGVSKKLMAQALKSFARTYIDYTNYICTEYWSFPAMSIESVRPTVMNNHLRILNVIEPIILKHGRKLNICNWFVLHKHLIVANEPKDICHFSVVKTDTVLKIHNSIWKEASCESGIA